MTQITNLFSQTQEASDLAPNFSLDANTTITYTAPGDSSIQYIAFFSFPSTARVWVGYNTTPTIPAAGTITQNARCQCNPTSLFVRGGDKLTFISSAVAAECGITLYTMDSSGN